MCLILGWPIKTHVCAPSMANDVLHLRLGTFEPNLEQAQSLQHIGTWGPLGSPFYVGCPPQHVVSEDRWHVRYRLGGGSLHWLCWILTLNVFAECCGEHQCGGGAREVPPGHIGVSVCGIFLPFMCHNPSLLPGCRHVPSPTYANTGFRTWCYGSGSICLLKAGYPTVASGRYGCSAHTQVA